MVNPQRAAWHFDQWMRGNPHALWADTIGHPTTAGMPTMGDVWEYFTFQKQPDASVMSHIVEYLDTHGFVQTKRGVMMKEPHQTLDDFKEGASMAVAVVSDALAAIHRQHMKIGAADTASATANDTSVGDALAKLRGGVLSDRLLAKIEDDKPGAFFFLPNRKPEQAQCDPSPKEDAGKSIERPLSSDLSFPAGLDPGSVKVVEILNVLFCLHNRQRLETAADLVETKINESFLDMLSFGWGGRFTFSPGQVTLLDLGNADIESETESDSSTESKGMLACVHGLVNGNDPYTASFVLGPKLLEEIASASNGVSATELSGEAVQEFMNDRGLTFPVPPPSPDASFASIIVEALVESSRSDLEAAARRANPDSNGADSEEETRSQKVSAQDAGESEENQPEVLSSTDAGGVGMQMDGSWTQVWSFARRVDARPSMRWDNDWVVADVEGAVWDRSRPCATPFLLDSMALPSPQLEAPLGLVHDPSSSLSTAAATASSSPSLRASPSTTKSHQNSPADINSSEGTDQLHPDEASPEADAASTSTVATAKDDSRRRQDV